MYVQHIQGVYNFLRKQSTLGRFSLARCLTSDRFFTGVLQTAILLPASVQRQWWVNPWQKTQNGNINLAAEMQELQKVCQFFRINDKSLKT